MTVLFGVAPAAVMTTVSAMHENVHHRTQQQDQVR